MRLSFGFQPRTYCICIWIYNCHVKVGGRILNDGAMFFWFRFCTHTMIVLMAMEYLNMEAVTDTPSHSPFVAAVPIRQQFMTRLCGAIVDECWAGVAQGEVDAVPNATLQLPGKWSPSHVNVTYTYCICKTGNCPWIYNSGRDMCRIVIRMCNTHMNNCTTLFCMHCVA